MPGSSSPRGFLAGGSSRAAIPISARASPHAGFARSLESNEKTLQPSLSLHSCSHFALYSSLVVVLLMPTQLTGRRLNPRQGLCRLLASRNGAQGRFSSDFVSDCYMSSKLVIGHGICSVGRRIHAPMSRGFSSRLQPDLRMNLYIFSTLGSPSSGSSHSVMKSPS